MRAGAVLTVVGLSFTLLVATPVRGVAQEQAKPQTAQTATRDNPTTPQSATAALSGRLLAADSGQPVRRATVSIASSENGFRRTATTDQMGAFAFTQLPPGQFTLSATRQGFLDVAYGQRTPGSGRPGTAIPLAAGQKLEDVSMRMPRTGVLTGLVTDEFGDPAMGVQVRAWRYVKRSGERTLAAVGGATTDDRGIYRIPGLLPGEYVVGTGARETAEVMLVEALKREAAVADRMMAEKMALDSYSYSYSVPAISGSRAPASGYASVYYPGTTQAASATSVTLGISEERAGVDMQMQVVPFSQITGSVIGPDGGTAAGVEVRLVDAAASPAARTYSAAVRPDGTFSFNSVPPGQYLLMARSRSRVNFQISGAPGEVFVDKSIRFDVEVETRAGLREIAGKVSPQATEQLWGRVDLAVDGNPLTNIVLPLQRGLDVSGAIDFDGTPPQPPELARMRVQLTPAAAAEAESGSTPPAAAYAAGRFTVHGVPPGRYRISASGLPAGWTLKSAMFGGQDVLDGTLEVKPGDEIAGGIVTFTNRSTELAGTLQDQNGKPLADYTIVAFSADRRFWTPNSRRIQAMRPSTDGRFSFRNLPAGEYRLIAVVDPEPGEWFDPAFLDQLLGAAMPISIVEGSKRTQDVRVVR